LWWRVVVAGVGLPSNEQDLADTLFRLNTNGTLDTSFGFEGVDNLVLPGIEDLGFYGVAVQSDGKIVALAETFNGVVVARVEANGQLDASFGSGGVTAILPVRWHCS
jgi:hypothetical protein